MAQETFPDSSATHSSRLTGIEEANLYVALVTQLPYQTEIDPPNLGKTPDYLDSTDPADL